MNVTIEPEPTTNSADFDPIFPDFSSFFFLCSSSVVQRLSSFEWPPMLD